MEQAHSNSETCFFCCKTTISTNSLDPNKIKDNPIIFNDSQDKGNSNIKNIQFLLRLSQYLNLPEEQLVNLEKIQESYSDFLLSQSQSSDIKFCENCNLIAETLNTLCEQLEDIQKKINSNLSLLSNQIILNHDNQDKQVDKLKDPQNLLSLKEIIQFKLRSKVEYQSVNPTMLLESYTTSEHDQSADNQLIMEDVDDDYEPPIKLIKEDPLLIKEEEETQAASCPFCEYLVIGIGGSKETTLHNHITTHHADLFPEDNLPTPAAPPIENQLNTISTNQLKYKISKPLNCPLSTKIERRKEDYYDAIRNLFICKFCGNVYTVWGSLRNHLRYKVNCGEKDKLRIEQENKVLEFKSSK